MPGGVFSLSKVRMDPDLLGTSSRKDCKMADQAHRASAERDTGHGCFAVPWFSVEDRSRCT